MRRKEKIGPLLALVTLGIHRVLFLARLPPLPAPDPHKIHGGGRMRIILKAIRLAEKQKRKFFISILCTHAVSLLYPAIWWVLLIPWLNTHILNHPAGYLVSSPYLILQPSPLSAFCNFYILTYFWALSIIMAKFIS